MVTTGSASAKISVNKYDLQVCTSVRFARGKRPSLAQVHFEMKSMSSKLTIKSSVVTLFLSDEYFLTHV